ncbi:MAG: hypothetical protein NTY98_01210 [Verrucomicrobia bacterium]|nr:hypothetical protein [Verrucomicrobiota bacterium]
MKLNDWLRWWMRIILPFVGWHVPVVLLRGIARGSNREVVLLCAGPKSKFILTRFFAQEPVVQRSTRVPVWRLQRLLDEWRSTADLVAVGIDRVSARLFLSPQYLAVPRWISSWMKVPEDLLAYGRMRKNAQADIRRIRIKNFEGNLSREAADLDLFYEKFYQPYVSARHGGMAQIAPRWMLRHVFKQGAILWVTQAGKRLAGVLVTHQNGQFLSYVNGVEDGRMDLLQSGVISALYVHSILEARQLGCTDINMGGSMPSLHDGVFRYKRKWTDSLFLGEAFIAANMVILLRWNRMEGAVAEFLSQTSLIYHDQEGFSALWVFPHDQPLTAESLEQHYKLLKTPGLRRFDILLPGAAPPGFTCPPGLRLIELAAVELTEAGGINDLG